MMATAINEKINWAIPYLVVAAVASLGTTWVLKTPETSQKAATLEQVETKVLPKVAKDLAATQTALKQSECDKLEYQSSIVDNVVSGTKPTWGDLHGCNKVKPVAPVPVTKLIPSPPKS